MKKFAVVLAGCGRKDGSEINEAITLLLSIEQHHCEYQCFAPDRPQTEVIDHLTDKKVTNAKRNILTEAARLARSKILPIEEYKAAFADTAAYTFGKATDVSSQVYCGPFLLTKLNPDSEVDLVKNENYYKADEVTLNSSMQFYRPGKEGSVLTARVTPRKTGKTICTLVCEVTDEEGTLIADSVQTFYRI